MILLIGVVLLLVSFSPVYREYQHIFYIIAKLYPYDPFGFAEMLISLAGFRFTLVLNWQ